MKLHNKKLVDLNGDPIPAGDNLMMTVALVLTTAALGPAPPNVQRGEKEVAARYDLAITLHKIEDTAEFEVPVDLVAALKADVLRLYPTLVAAQMLPVFEGTH